MRSDTFSTHFRLMTAARIRTMVAATMVAGLPLVMVACGEDNKKTSGTTGGGTTVTPNPGTTGNQNTTVPSGGTGSTAVTATNVTINTDSTSHKPVAAATHAVISYDGTKILGFSYDYCAWAASHSTADAANVKPPQSGEGAQFVIEIGTGQIQPAAGGTYTVNPQTTSGGSTYDNNIFGIYQTASTCRQTSRGPSSGTVTFQTVSDTTISGMINVQLAGWPDSTTAVLEGGFIAQKCTPSAGTSLTYAADPLACTTLTYD